MESNSRSKQLDNIDRKLLRKQQVKNKINKKAEV